jgi:hypothetical protein
MLSFVGQAIDKVFDDKRVTITVLVVWFVIVMVLFSSIGLFTTNYMAIGPNDNLTYMGMPLNTWPRYNAVLIFVIISTAINDLAGDAISPWILTCVCDVKSRVIPYSKSTCLLITQVWSCYCGVMSIASISLVFSQFDLLAVRLIVDLVVNQYTTMRFLRNKTHSAAEYNRFFEDTKPDDTIETGISLASFHGDDVRADLVNGVCKKDHSSDAVTVDVVKSVPYEEQTLLLSPTLNRTVT